LTMMDPTSNGDGAILPIQVSSETDPTGWRLIQRGYGVLVLPSLLNPLLHNKK
jgi:hypothetical protein